MRHATLLLLAFSTVGCTQRGVPIALQNQVAEYAPTAKLPERASLSLAGTKIDVDVTTKQADRNFEIVLSAYGEALEVEKYEATPGSFKLIEALGETYAPPPPLLGDGTSVEGAWKWKGTIASGGFSHDATASISAKDAEAPLDGLGGAARIVIMELSIVSDEQNVAKRTLSFTFVRQKGLLTREFGQGSTRLPVKPSEGENPPK